MNLILSILVWSIQTASIQQQAAEEVYASSEPQASRVAAFADEFFGARMEALHVPGAVFVMVRDTSILLSKGYGYADIETNRPVDPARTLFQVASVSKLFTATAVMQQAEQGRLDLNTDVNQYLEAFQIEEAFGKPVTLSQLLTHIAGFDERNVGYIAPDAASVVPLDQYLAARMPPRTLPPNDVFSYSNHGYGLAGHLVERASGEPFAGYVDNHIFEPLGMRRSTFRLPLPDSLSADLARGYRWTGEAYEPMALMYRNVPPAGGMSATAEDMARFAIAHLNGGRLGEAQILQEATTAFMHRQQFAHHPRLPGMAVGFMEQFVNWQRALQHGGDVPGYRSLLFLLPDHRAGFFLAYNASNSALRKEFVAQFMDRFYPRDGQVQALTPNDDVDLTPYTGTYLLNRYARRSVEKLYALFGNSFAVWSDSAGYLVTQDGKRWINAGSQFFRQSDDDVHMAFRVDQGGRVTHMFRDIDMGGIVPAAYEKLSWYETPRFVNEFYLSWIPVLLFTCILWPIGAGAGFLRASWKGRPRPQRSAGMIAARWTAGLFSAGAIWFAIAFIQKSLRMVDQGGGALLYGMPENLQMLLWIPIAQVGLAVVLLGFTAVAWRRKWWRLAGRMHYTIVTLAALAWIVFAEQYNLIGWNY